MQLEQPRISQTDDKEQRKTLATGHAAQPALRKRVQELREDFRKRRSKGETPSLRTPIGAASTGADNVLYAGAPDDGKGKVIQTTLNESQSECSCRTGAPPGSEDEAATNTDPPGALEVFSGRGMLRFQLEHAVLAALCIDHKGCRDKPVSKAFWLDVSTRDGQLQVWDLTAAGRIKYVPFAPLWHGLQSQGGAPEGH